MKHCDFLCYLSIIFLITILSGCAHQKHYMDKKMEPGIVVVLNGPSAAGKSSIQRAIQALAMPKLWVKVGIDNLFDFPLPDITEKNIKFWQHKNNIRWVSSTKDKENKDSIALHVGEDGEKVALAMNSAIAAYAHNGCNVIVDYIAYEKDWILDLQKKLSPYRVYYIAVDISLAELEKREATRKTSPIGHARSHYETVYSDIRYDLRVNTEKSSAENIAKEILQLVE